MDVFEQMGEVDELELDPELLEDTESTEELRLDFIGFVGVVGLASSLDQESFGWVWCTGSGCLVGVVFCEICAFLGEAVDEEMDEVEDCIVPLLSTESVRSFWNRSRLVDTMLNWILSLIDPLLVFVVVMSALFEMGGLGMFDRSLLAMIW